MNSMFVTPYLYASPEGPRSVMNDDIVHLRQGNMDGACGPYSLVSALITLGLLDREKIEDMYQWDGRTREGKFRDAMYAFGPLISGGTNDYDLEWLSSFFKTKNLQTDISFGSKMEIFAGVCNALLEFKLPIIGVDWPGGGGHWMLVVGAQAYEDPDSGDKQMTHLLCLDPGSETPKTSLWNAVIEVLNYDGTAINKGQFTCKYWGPDGRVTNCKLASSITLNT